MGKTSAARIVLREAGYDVIEFNASDTRSQTALREKVSELVSNVSIAGFVPGAQKGRKTSKMALVMDEVDGMSSGDRGGVSALIKLIDSSQVPVICICNDRGSQKIKSLANHCLGSSLRCHNI